MPGAHRTRRQVRHRARPGRVSIVKRWWFWTAIGVILLAVPVTWLGVRGLEAKSQLESAQALISVLKDQAVAFDGKGALATFEKIDDHTQTAIELTSDPVWRAAEVVPFLGKNLTVVRELAAATGTVMTDVAGPLIGLLDTVNPASFAPKNGAIDLTPFEATIPVLDAVTTATKSSLDEINAIDTGGTLGPLVSAKTKVSSLLGEIYPLLDLGNQVLPLLPTALGSETPRKYVIMFENNAEPRALGGTALSFAIVDVDKGKINLSQTIQAGLGNFPFFTPPVIPFEPGTQNVYAPDALAAFIPNVTTRPSFIGAATITQEMWLRTFGYTVDGIISVDPVFLSYVLRGSDPIVLSTGDSLTSETLVPLLLNGVYQRFNTGENYLDNLAQDAVYKEVVAATFARLTGGPLNPPELVKAIVQGWNEHRLLVWMANPDEQATLAKIGLNGELPVSDAKTDRAGLYFTDYVGSKLGFYLQQSVDVAQASCRTDGRESYRVTVTLTHGLDPAAADGLSPSVVGTWEAEGVPRAYQRMIVMLYSPPGSEMLGVTIDGIPANLSYNYDNEYPVELHTVLFAPGQSVTLTYDFIPAEPGKRVLETAITPLVNPTTLTKSALDCATVAAG